ncbi:hypothetical protein ASM33_04395 [Wolbachia endosymbiont of Folsomia candida]|nr:hypothetical protein [Wolbachia endosymbiont of Folsomia candida]APR99193.1 hypothetical protein ASM33_04395 [Wolbachia endosymbiont of Folsomia candida]
MPSKTNNTPVEEFIPVPQRKKEVAQHFDVEQRYKPRQIIEVQEKSEKVIPMPKRKNGVYNKPKDIIKPMEIKNEVRSEENIKDKKDELVVAEIINSIRDKLTKCWSIPEGLAYKENFSIKINLLLSSQGEIVMADVADSSSYRNNPLFRSIADSAMRAVYKCSPITNLPTQHHHIWREVTLDFVLNG